MRSPEKLRRLIPMCKKGEILQIGHDGLAARIGALRVIASWGLGWDHVSVSCAARLPKYAEMKFVKRLFFKPEEWAMELHAPVSEHIDIHPYTLHLWRPQIEQIPVPPAFMV